MLFFLATTLGILLLSVLALATLQKERLYGRLQSEAACGTESAILAQIDRLKRVSVVITLAFVGLAIGLILFLFFLD
ncbi:MAG TPA: hypothetical protein VLJ11_00495 [Bryobacteraceae bacterium]|nr:hypothetical protein [Bryobacteraceae bacterium]